MADNVSVKDASDTPVPVASDDIGGVQFQRFKNGYGADGSYTDVAPDAGLPVALAYREFTASVTSSGVCVAQTDIRGHSWFSLAWNGGSSSNILKVQFSADGTNWYDGVVQPVDSSNTTTNQTLQMNATTASYFLGYVPAKFFRANCTSYVSGTSVLTINFFSVGMPDWQKRYYMTGASPGSGSDAYNNALLGGVGGSVNGAAGFAYNGTSWDRARSATAADNTSGTGLVGAGLVGWDGSVYRRVRTDANGYLQTERVPLATATSGKTTVTTAGTRVQLASNAGSGVILKASRLNASTIYVGGSAVAASNGLELEPGESMNAAVSNTNLLYVDSAVSGDYVTWLVVA